MKRLNTPLIVSAILVVLLVVAFLVFRPKQTNQVNKTRGVLAVNTDKSVYLPGESVKFQMASLDSTGQTLCHSNLKLDVNGIEQIIIKSSSCGDNNVTNEPDYMANLLLVKEGTYKITLINLDDRSQISSSFIVQQARDLEIVRNSAIRINPFKSDRYPMVLSITATKDYQGQIKEQVPADFKIIWQGSAKIEGTNLVWDVNLKAGETRTFSYEYQAPKKSPGFYRLGEKGEWQIISGTGKDI